MKMNGLMSDLCPVEHASVCARRRCCQLENTQNSGAKRASIMRVALAPPATPPTITILFPFNRYSPYPRRTVSAVSALSSTCVASVVCCSFERGSTAHAPGAIQVEMPNLGRITRCSRIQTATNPTRYNQSMIFMSFPNRYLSDVPYRRSGPDCVPIRSKSQIIGHQLVKAD